MRTTRLFLWLALSGVLTVTVVSQIAAKSAADKPPYAIEDVEQQVVLYTIHRGGFDDIASVMMNLFGLAGEKGLYPSEPLAFTYLNNFAYTSSEHWLTEIRLSVGKEALKLAGTLGKFTDVKTLPAMKVAVATKPEGLADSGPIYEGLYTWIVRQGFVPEDRPSETFLTNTQTQDYAQMKTKIMVPVRKIPQK